MANIHIKSDERRNFEEKVMRDFGIDPSGPAERRELGEAIAARSREAVDQMKRMEDKHR